jgi:hypothetical protein
MRSSNNLGIGPTKTARSLSGVLHHRVAALRARMPVLYTTVTYELPTMAMKARGFPRFLNKFSIFSAIAILLKFQIH